MNKITLSTRDKKSLIRIAVSLALFLAIFISDKVISLDKISSLGFILPFVLYLGVYLLIGYDIIFKAIRNIIGLNPLDENFLMLVATVGAFTLAIIKGVRGEKIEGFDEACAVLLFYQVGEFFQRYATDKARGSISSLMDIRPDYANIIRNGVELKVLPEDVSVNEVIIVYPGEKIPLDGVIIKGNSSVDTRALTGESVPREAMCGDRVLSGSVNLTSAIEIMVDTEFYNSTVSRILELVESASDKKSRAEGFITRFATVYTPIVVFLALALALIPGFITNNWGEWIYRSLSFLVVSCPCALVISIPLTFFMGIGTLSRKYVLVKGSVYLEKLSKADIIAFDKTGTVTKGEFAVDRVVPENKREVILRLAATTEKGSSHPIAHAILCEATEAEEGYIIENKAGYGVIARKDNKEILCGNFGMMKLFGINAESDENEETVVYVAENNEYVGKIYVRDKIKAESYSAISQLKKLGANAVLLSGDKEKAVEKVAQSVGISCYKGALLPKDKVEEVEKLIKSKKKRGQVCFVGDGINDAPVLMRADVGVSMGGIGSDAAIEASDIVLMKDDLSTLPLAKRIAIKTVRIVKQNLIFALGIKAAILILSAFGITNMWIAVFGDVGVAILCILNAMRVGKAK